MVQVVLVIVGIPAPHIKATQPKPTKIFQLISTVSGSLGLFLVIARNLTGQPVSEKSLNESL